MIGINFQFVDQTSRVVKAEEVTRFKNFRHAAAAIRKDAVESILSAEGPSAPGTPPHTHTGGVIKRGKNAGKQRKGNFQRAIAFDADKESAIIGPRFSVVALAGRAHELGTEFHGDMFPERAYMKPALDKNLNRFAQDWAGSIGE